METRAGDSALGPESVLVDLPQGIRLHLARFRGSPAGPAVFMLHGAIENGRIFWSRSGRGLAPWLASRGFDVFVADLRGHGLSEPRLGPRSDYGQTEAITEDLPALIDAVAALSGGEGMHWIAHSWGGVLLSAFLARYPERRSAVLSCVYFGSKRTVRCHTPQRFLYVDLVWGLVCSLAAAMTGSLPARRMGIGSDDETARFYRQCRDWVRRDAWVDGGDGFDYAAALRDEVDATLLSPSARRASMPPTWFIAGRNDHALGHPDDVRDFMESLGGGGHAFTLLGRTSGNLRDYGHIDMLTHPDAPLDHFPAVESWLRKRGQAATVPEGDER